MNHGGNEALAWLGMGFATMDWFESSYAHNTSSTANIFFTTAAPSTPWEVNHLDEIVTRSPGCRNPMTGHNAFG